jgi:predicted dehydrogenase
MTIQKTKIGVVGCGAISGIYLQSPKTFEAIEIAAVSDMFPEKAKARAAEYNIAKVYTLDELLADPEIQIVLNITNPQAHAEVALKAVAAGKSVHSEKPFTLTREEGQKLLAAAKAKGVRVGCAPDTFLGGGLQTCRKLIDDGWIGQPIACTAFMAGHGPESWHPNPDFYYQIGAGPMFDMGPYYLTALVMLMGPVKRVAGMARITFPERLITSQPYYGQIIKVNVPTHTTGLLEFASGAIGTIITSFDVWGHSLPRIEIHGTEGSLSVPDPNTFGGPVKVRRAGEKEWLDVPLTHIYTENSRGIGVADMAYALRSGRPHRCAGEMAYHVLDLMHAFHDSAKSGRQVEIASACVRPAPLPLGLRKGALDA